MVGVGNSMTVIYSASFLADRKNRKAIHNLYDVISYVVQWKRVRSRLLVVLLERYASSET